MVGILSKKKIDELMPENLLDRAKESCHMFRRGRMTDSENIKLEGESGKKTKDGKEHRKTKKKVKSPEHKIHLENKVAKMKLIQEKKKKLIASIRLPPALYQFKLTLSSEKELEIFKLLEKIKGETKLERKARLKKEAKRELRKEKLKQKSGEAENDKASGNSNNKDSLGSLNISETKGEVKEKKDETFQSGILTGLSRISKLVERKSLSLVLIAGDTDPIDLIVWLPSLCRKMGVPYAIVKSKARLGQLARFKKCTVVGVPLVENIQNMDNSEKKQLKKFADFCRSQFNEKPVKEWGKPGSF